MALSMAAFASNDAGIKFAAETLPLYEAIAIRGVMVSLLLLGFAWLTGGLDLRIPRGDRLRFGVRLLAEVGSSLLFLHALTHMPLGALSAIMQSLPLLVMLAAALVFGERIGWRRLSAVGVGLVGVALIVRPGSDSFNVWSLYGLGAVLLLVAREITTRRLSAGIRSSTVALAAAVGVTLSAFVLPDAAAWRVPRVEEVGALTISACFLSVGYVAAVAAMRVGEVSFVSPFRYTQLLVAMALGFAVFGEVPRLTTWIGAALLVGAGVYSIWREQRLRARGR
ncbi:EamA family transporter [Paracoccus sp. S-4012]|nr:EamA family transporter [Paracoccus sp. S-4012]